MPRLQRHFIRVGACCKAHRRGGSARRARYGRHRAPLRRFASIMPRASWKGFLRLSLVSCPVYLVPATTRTKAIRLRQVWMPRGQPQEPADAEGKDEAPQPTARQANQEAAVE